MFDLMRRARPSAATVFLSLFLVACGDDDDPAELEFNEQTASEFADATEDVLRPAIAGFEVSGVIATAYDALGGAGAIVLAPTLPLELASRASSSSLLRARVTRPGPFLTSSSAADAVIPEELQGTTFVWDFEAGGYVPSEETGAPADGVRFVYYEMDGPIPAEPLVERGRLDLIDASTTAAARLEVLLVQNAGNVTLADYFVQASIVSNLETTTATLSSEGYVSDGEEQLDFTIGMTQAGAEDESSFSDDAEIVIENDAAGARLILDYEFDADESGQTESGEFTIEKDGNEAVFQYAMEGTDVLDTIEGELLFNGGEVVIFSAEGDEEIEYTRPDGSALTQTEIEALAGMWIGYIFTAFFAYSVVLPFLALVMAP